MVYKPRDRMRRIFVLIILMICTMHAADAVRIVEFCPDPYLHDDSDEYLVIAGNGSLDGIAISDGEGGFRFPPGSAVHGSVTIARSAPAFEQSHGRLPDFEWVDYSPIVPDVISGNQLRMANTKDDLMLYENGSLVQTITWPGDVKPREGQVHYRENGEWDPRPLMLGQSRLSPAVFRHVSVTTFVSPDCSNTVFSDAMNSATKSLFVNMYEFSSPEMGESLVAARVRGVDVRVLVEGGPVGGINADEKSLIWHMNTSGIPVLSMTSSKTEHAPYRYDHAKYVVIDNTSLLVTSENFKYSGFPPPGTSGNRGWGVYLRDPALAGYFSGIFTTDTSSRSAIPYAGSAGAYEQVTSGKHMPEFTPEHFEDATVTPVIAPDTSFEIITLINRSQKSVEIEQAYIKNETSTGLNPYLAAAINASRRGVHVRVLLDAYWFNVEGPNDNDEMAALINRISAAEHLPLEAKCIDLTVSQLEKIHNKGVIVDDNRVLVSSINWNSNSPNFNREAGVIIDHPGVATYFRRVFDDDWNSRAPTAVTTDYRKIAIVSLVIILLLMVYYRRRRT